MSERSSRREASRQQVLHAVFRLVERGGIAEVSLRAVATESGINIGSVRHLFGNHEALMTAAAEEVGARMQRRLDPSALREQAPTDGPGRRALLHHVVDAVLPSAEEDSAELVVLQEFLAAARLRPEFRPITERMGRDLRELVREALRLAHVDDPDVEAERFAALIAGLTFDLVHPHGAPPELSIQDVVRRHIADLVPS